MWGRTFLKILGLVWGALTIAYSMGGIVESTVGKLKWSGTCTSRTVDIVMIAYNGDVHTKFRNVRIGAWENIIIGDLSEEKQFKFSIPYIVENTHPERSEVRAGLATLTDLGGSARRPISHQRFCFLLPTRHHSSPARR
jgi:hypothetical protein